MDRIKIIEEAVKKIQQDKIYFEILPDDEVAVDIDEYFNQLDIEDSQA